MDTEETLVHSFLIALGLVVAIYATIISQNPIVLLIFVLSILFGVASWIATKLVSERMARVFFYVQKFSWFHLIFKLRVLDDKYYFLTYTPKSSTSSLFLLWVGSWAFVVFIAYNLMYVLNLSFTDDVGISSSFDVLILAWIMTPVVSLIVVPISIMEASDLRLFLKIKQKIISPTTPFRYVIGGFVTMNILQTMLRGLDISELIASLVYLPVPFYVMTWLYKGKTESSIVKEFVSFLNGRNIVRKNIKID